MTPTEALEIVDKVTAEMQTTRAGHTKILEALSVLKQLVEITNGKNT